MQNNILRYSSQPTPMLSSLSHSFVNVCFSTCIFMEKFLVAMSDEGSPLRRHGAFSWKISDFVTLSVFGKLVFGSVFSTFFKRKKKSWPALYSGPSKPWITNINSPWPFFTTHCTISDIYIYIYDLGLKLSIYMTDYNVFAICFFTLPYSVFQIILKLSQTECVSCMFWMVMVDGIACSRRCSIGDYG